MTLRPDQERAIAAKAFSEWNRNQFATIDSVVRKSIRTLNINLRAVPERSPIDDQMVYFAAMAIAAHARVEFLAGEGHGVLRGAIDALRDSLDGRQRHAT